MQNHNYPTCKRKGWSDRICLSFIHSFILSVAKKILRWRELAPSRTSEHIRSFEDTPILLTCTCYWADSLPLATISAVFLLSGPFCQPFYLRPWVTPICHVFTYIHHAHAQQLTLHSGCGVYSIWWRWTNHRSTVKSAWGMCSVELSLNSALVVMVYNLYTCMYYLSGMWYLFSHRWSSSQTYIQKPSEWCSGVP